MNVDTESCGYKSFVTHFILTGISDELQQDDVQTEEIVF